MKNTQDVCNESVSESMGWTKVDKDTLKFPYNHERALVVADAERAVRKIEEEVKVFPFQIRYSMALPLWNRFANMYCQSGDVELALGYI